MKAVDMEQKGPWMELEAKGQLLYDDPIRIGLYRSGHRYRLVFDQEDYDLNEGRWDVELLLGKQSKLFIFYWFGEARISLKFDRNEDFFFSIYQLKDKLSRTHY